MVRCGIGWFTDYKISVVLQTEANSFNVFTNTAHNFNSNTAKIQMQTLLHQRWDLSQERWWDVR